MPTFTAQQLIDRAKAAADMHDNFVTEAQLLDWVSVEHQALSALLARQGMVQTMQSVSITFSGALGPQDMNPTIAILGVYEEQNGRHRRLRQNNVIDGRRQTPSVTSPVIGPATEYMIYFDGVDVKIEFYPNPASGTYTIYFVPLPDPIDAVSDTVFYTQGFEEWIVLGVAARCLAKEEGDTTLIERRRRIVEQHVEEAAWTKNIGQAPTIRNVDRVERGWSPGSKYWPPPVSEWVFM